MKVNEISFQGSAPINYSKLEIKPEQGILTWGKFIEAGDIVQITCPDTEPSVGLITNVHISDDEFLDEGEFDCINLTRLINNKELSTIHVEKNEYGCGGNVVSVKYSSEDRSEIPREISRIGHINVFA